MHWCMVKLIILPLILLSLIDLGFRCWHVDASINVEYFVDGDQEYVAAIAVPPCELPPDEGFGPT